MPVRIRNFDVIVGMDWLIPHHADIMCYERRIRLHLPDDKTLVVYGDKPSTNLRIVSCIKARKYLHKRYDAFLAHVVDQKKEVKSIKEIPEVCDFSDVFPEDLSGVSPARQVEFRIDLIPGATLVAKAPYRLAFDQNCRFEESGRHRVVRATELFDPVYIEVIQVKLTAWHGSELETSGQVLKRTWIGVEGSSRAPTIESTGSAFESGVGHEESN
ncbi:hypothetical protein L2E82_35874 [Cichorium intybus]|uniref:Uncharacterized protein n=1 Tax=Cichorium intybus TaxID=13427 RepID=A0ACB9BPZ1_CICIN|nr:hypothetical protein L2E82_35874 [Cichorium intybus]